MADAETMLPCSLVLAGGLGLGAYQAGAVSTLLAAGRLRFEAIAGASIGALNGAVIAGGPIEQAPERLRGFWDSLATEIAPLHPLDPLGWSDRGTLRHARNWTNTLTARVSGARGLFRPRMLQPSETPSLYETAPAAETLSRFVDYEYLSRGALRLCVATTDIETGAVVLFDTARGDRIEVDHLLASGALLPAFPAVRIGDRLLGDGGFAANAPLEPFLASDRHTAVPPLCILLDLFAPEMPAPRTFEDAVARSTDLQFATQTTMRLDALVRERALEARLGGPGADLLHLCYRPSPDEAGPEKTYDFSRRTLADRFAKGEADARAALDLLAGLEPSTSGLRVHRVSAAPAPVAAQPATEIA